MFFTCVFQLNNCMNYCICPFLGQSSSKNYKDDCFESRKVAEVTPQKREFYFISKTFLLTDKSYSKNQFHVHIMHACLSFYTGIMSIQFQFYFISLTFLIIFLYHFLWIFCRLSLWISSITFFLHVE